MKRTKAAARQKRKYDFTSLPRKDVEYILSHPEFIYAEKARRDFSYFVKFFWDCVSNDELVWNWHLDYLARQLSKVALQVSRGAPREKDIIINISPGTTKSTLCSVMFPVWCWVNWYWMRFIASSYSGALAMEQAELSRELVRSTKFSQAFPELAIKRDKDTKSNFRITKRMEDSVIAVGGSRFSTSVGGTLTGFHGHILLVDDPLDPNRAVSKTELENANRWISQTLSTRKVDKAVTPTILIMQRLHQDDPTGHLLAKKKNIFHICIPGEIKNYEHKVNPPELISYYQDGLMDPNRLSESVLEDLQADLGQYGYAGQIGQDPTPPGGGMFKVDHFQYVTSSSVSSMLENVDRGLRYWDKAGTEGGKGAATVGVKMYRLANGKFLVSDVRRGRWSTNEREQMIKQTAEADGASVQVWIEQEPGSGGKESAEGTIRNLAGYSVHADRPTGDKVFRADPYSVQVNNGNVLLLQADWNADFVEEHRFFPFGTTKDQVDAAAGAFNKLVKKRRVRVLH